MPLTILTKERLEELNVYGVRMARKWKNYFSLEGLLPGIVPTNEQKQMVQSSEKQLIIRGSAGSGKSLMLAYRLIKTMEQSEKPQRILYVTFNETLIQDTCKRLNQSEKFKQLRDKHEIVIQTYHDVAKDILKKHCGYHDIQPFKATKRKIEEHESFIVTKVDNVLGRFKNSDEYEQYERLYSTHTPRFLMEEFFWMKGNGLITKDAYLKKERTGRGRSPSVTRKQRETIFRLFELYNEFLRENFKVRQYDMEDYALLLLNELNNHPNAPFRFDHIFVDEFQDLQPMQIKSLVKLAKNSITLVGDDKQRIYKRTPISYKDLDLRINARTYQKLTKNFRSTKQIMKLANSLKFEDVENVREDAENIFKEGKKPYIKHFKTERRMVLEIIDNIKEIHRNDPDKTIAVVHRYDTKELFREGNLKTFLDQAFDVVGVESFGKRFDYKKKKKPVFFTNPYEIKGLEFDYVFVIHFDQLHYPLEARLDELKNKYGKNYSTDENYKKDRRDVLNDEKKVLYVACTRAKKELYLYFVGKDYKNVSRFIRDFDMKDFETNMRKSDLKRYIYFKT